MSEPSIPLLIRGAEVYAPEPSGVCDVLCVGGTVLAVGDRLSLPGAGREIDASGQLLVPGLIDGHVHIAGAGGEGGPGTRTPEMPLSWMVEAGITSVVGLLGADGVTRNLDNLLMKAKAIRAAGLSAWVWTGSYQLPVPTVTGDVTRDLSIIDEVIGVGEVAIADHRSSTPTALSLARLANQARLGGMLGGKCGLLHIHLGDGQKPFQLLYDAVAESELAPTQFYPTHVNRNPWCFEDAKAWGKRGPVDVTAAGWEYFQDEEVKPSRAVRELLDAGVPLDNVTMTSDACGSLPQFDDAGNLVRLVTSRLDCLWRETADLIRDEGLALPTALAPVTSNPARILGLAGKGHARPGADADLLLVDQELMIRTVVAGGAVVMHDGELLLRGAFE